MATTSTCLNVGDKRVVDIIVSFDKRILLDIVVCFDVGEKRVVLDIIDIVCFDVGDK